MAPTRTKPEQPSPSEKLEQLAHALTDLADDVLQTVQELREQEQHDDQPRP